MVESSINPRNNSDANPENERSSSTDPQYDQGHLASSRFQSEVINLLAESVPILYANHTFGITQTNSVSWNQQSLANLSAQRTSDFSTGATRSNQSSDQQSAIRDNISNQQSNTRHELFRGWSSRFEGPNAGVDRTRGTRTEYNSVTDSHQALVRDFRGFAMRQGMPEVVLQQFERSLTRLEQKYGADSAQMRQVRTALREIMDGNGGPAKAFDRANAIISFVNTAENTSRFGNQGNAMNCVLQSAGNVNLDEAYKAIGQEAIALAQVINTGSADIDIHTGNGNRQRVRITIPQASLVADQASRQIWSDQAFGTRGERSYFSQCQQALYGQLAANQRGQEDGRQYVYLATGLNERAQGYRLGQGGTNEGLCQVGANGQLQFICEGPGLDANRVGRLVYTVTGKPFVIHSSMATGSVDSRYVQVVNSAREMADTFRNGPRVVGLDAGRLPGARDERHAGHALVGRLNNNGTVALDNLWGDASDSATNNLSLASLGNIIDNDAPRQQGQAASNRTYSPSQSSADGTPAANDWRNEIGPNTSTNNPYTRDPNKNPHRADNNAELTEANKQKTKEQLQLAQRQIAFRDYLAALELYNRRVQEWRQQRQAQRRGGALLAQSDYPYAPPQQPALT